MKRPIGVILATSLGLAALAPVQAAPDSVSQGESLSSMIRGRVHERLGGKHLSYGDAVLKRTAELKLTDEQIGKITRIQQETKQPIEDLGRNVHRSMKAAHELFLNPAADETEIRKAAQAHTNHFNNLVDVALKARTAINGVLTPEQLQKFKSVKPG